LDPDLDETALLALVSGSASSPLVSCDAGGGGGGGDRSGGGGGGGGRSTHGLGERRPPLDRSVIPGRFLRCFFGMKQRGILSFSALLALENKTSGTHKPANFFVF
jgi:hypothetical protein